MREISEAILDDVRAAVPLSPSGTDTERPDPIPDEFVWIRPASTTRGDPRLGREMRSGTLAVDVWTKSVLRLHEIVDSLVFLDEHREPEYGDARHIHYREQSAMLDEEAEAYHFVLTYSVTFYDARRASLF